MFLYEYKKEDLKLTAGQKFFICEEEWEATDNDISILEFYTCSDLKRKMREKNYTEFDIQQAINLARFEYNIP